MGEFDDDNVIVLPGLATEANNNASEGLESALPSSPPAEHLVEAVVEALLLASDRPLSLDELDAVMCGPGLPSVREALGSIQDRLRRGAGGIRLVEVAKGWQLRTDPRAATWVAALRGGRPSRLSRAALETLTVVAFRQPVARSEVEGLRGVDSGGVMRMLVERELVAVVGRKDEPGRPLLYGTTQHFLEVFGLRDLSELPTLRDLRELADDDARGGPEETWPVEVTEVGEVAPANEPSPDGEPPESPPPRTPLMLRPLGPR